MAEEVKGSNMSSKIYENDWVEYEEFFWSSEMQEHLMKVQTWKERSKSEMEYTKCILKD